MKDYRTWWRRVYEEYVDGWVEDYAWYEVDELSDDRNTIDCMCEQIWAEHKGLA